MDGGPLLTVSWPVYQGERIVRRHLELVRHPEACCDGCGSRRAMPALNANLDVWSLQRVREAVREAMVVLRLVGYGPNGRPLELKAWWPDVVHDAAEAYGFNRAAAQRRATAEEIAHLDRVLPWLYWIKRAAVRKAVVGFALGMPSRIVGRESGCSHTTARARETEGLSEILRKLREQR